MSFEARCERALAIPAKTGIWQSNYAPPALHFLWKLGVQVPPPHFARFLPTTLWLGGTFGVVWGLAMWFFVWSNQRMAPVAAVLTSLISGALFGLLMAAYYAHGRRKYNLPDWQSLDGA